MSRCKEYWVQPVRCRFYMKLVANIFHTQPYAGCGGCFLSNVYNRFTYVFHATICMEMDIALILSGLTVKQHPCT